MSSHDAAPEPPNGPTMTSELPNRVVKGPQMPLPTVDGGSQGMPLAKREPLIVEVPATRMRLDAERAANRPSSYKCKTCGEKGHNARSKTCGFTPEERAERTRVAAKIRSGLRK